MDHLTHGLAGMTISHLGFKRKAAFRTVVMWRELAYAFLPGEHFSAKVVFEKNRILTSEFKF